MMKVIKRIFYTLTALVLVYMVYLMSITLLKVGFNSASKDFFFITLSIYLAVPLIKIIKDKRNIPKDAVITNKMKKTLKQLNDDNITKLQGVTIKYNNLKEYVDSIVITQNGLFNIVFCNYRGDILIKKNDAWFKESSNEAKEIVSPLDKIKRNRKVLNKRLNADEIIDVIVMTDAFSDVYEEESSSVPIVRYDDFVNFISEYISDIKYDEEELYDKLYPLIHKEKDLQKETALFERYLENRWQYRSRVAIISFFVMFYIFKITNFI